jgi:hypothetical protein
LNVEGDQYGKRALDFVQRLQQLTNYDEVCRHITAELEWFGFSWVTSFSIPGPGCQLKDGILLNNRPKEYVDRYAEKNYVIHDPVVKELRRNMNPYSWGGVREGRDLKKSERAIIDEARDCRVETKITDCLGADAGRSFAMSVPNRTGPAAPTPQDTTANMQDR